MQLYIALTFWLMVALFEAYGTFKIWESMVRPRWIHVVLLPGTVIAETARFLAALLSGSPVRDAKLLGDEPVGQSAGPGETKQGVPVLGPLLMALLPILAGLVVIYLLFRHFDRGIVNAFNVGDAGGLARALTFEPADWFAMARDMISQVERLINALPTAGADAWQGWLFVYLTACMAVRMVPLKHNIRHGMAAVLLVGLIAVGLGLIEAVRAWLLDSWALLSYTIGLLTALLVLSLLVRGLVSLIMIIANKHKSGASAPRGQAREVAAR